MVYADGVPKEGISSDELLVSMTFMMLVKEKVSLPFSSVYGI